MTDKKPQSKLEEFAAFKQRMQEAFDAANGDNEFLSSEVGRIIREQGGSENDAEEISDKVAEDLANFEEKSQTCEGRDEILMGELAHISVELTKLQCFAEDFVRVSDALFVGLLESAAKSPKHFSAWAKQTLDAARAESAKREEQNNG